MQYPRIHKLVPGWFARSPLRGRGLRKLREGAAAQQSGNLPVAKARGVMLEGLVGLLLCGVKQKRFESFLRRYDIVIRRK